MRTELLRFNGAVERDPTIDTWMKAHSGELGAIASQWFEVMRKCGDEVRELLHDGCPTACLGDAAFCYVNVFTSHVNVGRAEQRVAQEGSSPSGAQMRGAISKSGGNSSLAEENGVSGNRKQSQAKPD